MFLLISTSSAIAGTNQASTGNGAANQNQNTGAYNVKDASGEIDSVAGISGNFVLIVEQKTEVDNGKASSESDAVSQNQHTEANGGEGGSGSDTVSQGQLSDSGNGAVSQDQITGENNVKDISGEADNNKDTEDTRDIKDISRTGGVNQNQDTEVGSVKDASGEIDDNKGIKNAKDTSGSNAADQNPKTGVNNGEGDFGSGAINKDQKTETVTSGIGKSLKSQDAKTESNAATSMSKKIRNVR